MMTAMTRYHQLTLPRPPSHCERWPQAGRSEVRGREKLNRNQSLIGGSIHLGRVGKQTCYLILSYITCPTTAVSGIFSVYLL